MPSSLMSRCLSRISLVILLTLGASVCTAGDFHDFARALEQRGWQTDRDPDGNLLLYPATGTPRTAVSEPRRDSGTLDALAERLTATGWQVDREADGSITFRAANNTHEQARITQPPRPDTRLADLGERLAAAGWGVSHGADGSHAGERGPCARDRACHP